MLSPNVISPFRNRRSGSFDLASLNPVAWYDAGGSGLLQTAGGAAVSNNSVLGYWPDLSGNNYHAVKWSDGSRPTWRTEISWLFGGRPFVQFAGAHSLNITGITGAAADWTVFAVAASINGSTESRVIDVLTGRLICALNGASAGSYFDGAWQGATIPGKGQQVWTWDLTAASGGKIYASNLHLTAQSDANYTQRAFGGSSSIGAVATGGSAFAQMYLAELIICPRVSDAVRPKAVAKLVSKYGLFTPIIESRSVLCIGDSLTEGANVTNPYPTQLLNRMQAQAIGTAAVQNAGVGGSVSSAHVTTYNANKSGKTDVIIWSGLNDVRLGSGSAAAAAWSNIDTMVTDALGLGKRVALVTVTPFKGDTLQTWTLAKHNDMEALNASIRARSGVTLIDANLLFRDASDSQKLDAIYDLAIPDHVHINQLATDILFEQALAFIRA
jgi:lysophospholipase L1-like esterase